MRAPFAVHIALNENSYKYIHLLCKHTYGPDENESPSHTRGKRNRHLDSVPPLLALPFGPPPLTFISEVFVFCVYTYAYNVTEECLCYQETSSFEYFLAALNAAFVIYTTSHVVIKKKRGINFYENVLFFRYHVLLMIQFI